MKANRYHVKIVATIFLALTFCSKINAEEKEINKMEFRFPAYSTERVIAGISDYPDHDLGSTIARKLAAIKKLYLLRYETKVAFTDTEVEVQKPDILAAVEKLDKYYRKSVEKNEISRQDASFQFSKYLDIAYSAFFEETISFEKELHAAKKTTELIAVFNRVILEE